MTFNQDWLPRMGRIFIHPCCACGADDASFGYGCHPRADRGRWFCAACRAEKLTAGLDLDNWLPDGWPYRDDSTPSVVVDKGGQGRLFG